MILQRTFKPKIEVLQKTGFRGPLLRQLLKGCPGIMKLSKKQLERKWKFLHMVAEASLEDVAAVPQVLLLKVQWPLIVMTENLSEPLAGPE